METSCIRTISIVGLGLIGASVLRALKKSPLAAEQGIVFKGYDPSFTREDIDQLEAIGLDRFETRKEALYNSDLIILAAPVEANIQLLAEIRRLAPDQTLVSDVSSTKAAISKRADELNLRFIGMHPIAGREQQGYHASHDELLSGKTVVLCADESTLSSRDAVNLMELLQSIGCRTTFMTPEEHDRVVAAISHLPQLLSSALTTYCENDVARSGPGFSTLTRLAGSSWDVWQGIVSTNRENISQELSGFCTNLEQLADDIRNGRMDKVRVLFEKANSLYDQLNKKESS